MARKDYNNLYKNVLHWYDNNKRDLPWRKTKNQKKDAYKIWVSEIMLQQTTVKAVIPYYNSFIKKWPNIKKLSESSVDEVLEFWSGLGYYSRAKNLHNTSKIVTKKFNGVFPDNYQDLISLPGIGRYTAGAILSIAFNKDALVIDSNIERIILRLGAIKKDPKRARKEVEEIAKRFTPSKRTGDYVQALMDIGSSICKSQNPNCINCPINLHCLANKKGLTAKIPLKQRKISKKLKKGIVFWITSKNNNVYLNRRPYKGILPGTLGFPCTKWSEERLTAKDKEFSGINNWQTMSGEINHSFSHFDLQLKIYSKYDFDEKKLKGEWKQKTKIDKIGLPTLMKKIYLHALNVEKSKI